MQVENYLKATFPLVHSKLALENINTHGLLYTWKGSDPSLKPSMLMAHQDTVPVNSGTLDDWTHRAFLLASFESADGGRLRSSLERSL